MMRYLFPSSSSLLLLPQWQRSMWTMGRSVLSSPTPSAATTIAPLSTSATTAATAAAAATTEETVLLPSKRPGHCVTTLSLANVLDASSYQKQRKEVLAQRRAVKATRSVYVGPYCSVNFLNYDILWCQVQEMCHIERGGVAQAKEEIAAYAPLLPTKDYLTFTFMIQIDNRPRRVAALKNLVEIENSIVVAGTPAEPIMEDGVDRTTKDRTKTSAVHFMRLPLTAAMKETLLAPSPSSAAAAEPLTIAITHKNYSHIAALSPEVLASLREDYRLIFAASSSSP